MKLYQCIGKYTETSEKVSHIDHSDLDKVHADTAPRGALYLPSTNIYCGFLQKGFRSSLSRQCPGSL